jgi:hypothetical protein
LKQRAVRKLIVKLGAAKLAAAAAVAFCVVLFCLALLAMLGGATQSKAAGAMSCHTVGTGKESPPERLIPIYQAASNHYHLGPRGASILTGINFVETNFGTNMGPSSAGAEGWMQFMPEVWEEYGVDANGDGVRDAYNPWDAIFAAARYLKANGAPGDWYKAIFAYNHADWYVQEVEEAAAKYGGRVVCTPTTEQVLGGNALLQHAETLSESRAFKPIPASLWEGGGAPESVDSRIWPDVMWVLQTFHLRVTAARETGHNTHGDGTAVDTVPQAGKAAGTPARLRSARSCQQSNSSGTTAIRVTAILLMQGKTLTCMSPGRARVSDHARPFVRLLPGCASFLFPVESRGWRRASLIRGC